MSYKPNDFQKVDSYADGLLENASPEYQARVRKDIDPDADLTPKQKERMDLALGVMCLVLVFWPVLVIWLFG